MAMGWREYSVWYQASHNLTQLIDNSMSSSKSAALESQNDPVILRSFYYLIPVQEGICELIHWIILNNLRLTDFVSPA
jgi:hypothetical protein